MQDLLRQYIAVSVIALALSAYGHADVSSGKFPNKGQRIYVVNRDEPAALVVIKTSLSEAETSAKATLMRDPNLLGASSANVRQKAPVQPAKRAVVTSPASALTFNAASVVGRKTEPRVNFQLGRLEVPRLDEPFPAGSIETTLDGSFTRSSEF